MTEDRKASEVLLSIEKKVSLILDYQKVLDKNIKHVMQHINLSKHSAPKNTEPVVTTPSVVERKSPAAEKKEKPAYDKPAIIQQRVVYEEDQRPVILADVKVYSAETGTLMKHTRTNASGFWDAKLLVGKYRVEVKKGPNATKKGFIKKYEIDVAGSGSQELERKLV